MLFTNTHIILLACTAPTDRSFWRQDHKDALPQGWGIKAKPYVKTRGKNPPHPLMVIYYFYSPAGGKKFLGLSAAKAAAKKYTAKPSSSSRKSDASKRSSSSEGTSSDEEEQEEEEESEDESDEETAKNDHKVLSATGGDVHSRHPWFKKWLKDGRNAADLLPEQYPKGYDPKRNESKLECFNRTGEEERSAKGC